MKRLTLILLLGICGIAHADGAQKVLECMRGNLPPTLRLQDFELTTTETDANTQVLRGRLYGLSEKEADTNHVRVMLHVKEPASLAGSAFLLREATGARDQGMYVYLPSVRRVRRVTGEFADGALLGSAFNYQDFKQLQNAFEGLASTQEAAEVLEKRPVHVLSFKPLPGSPSAYSRIRSWVDQQTCVPLKVEFYQQKTLRKQLIVPVAALQQSNQYWYATEATIRDLKEGRSSQLKVLKVQSGGKLSKNYFDPGLFYLGG